MELLDIIKEFDGEILRLLVEIEEVLDEGIVEEIRCVGDLRGEFIVFVVLVEEVFGGNF